MVVYIETLAFFSHICLRFTEEYCAGPWVIRWIEFHIQIVYVLPVADVLQVAARVLAAQLGLGAVGLQAGVGIPAQLGAGGDAAGGGVSHLPSPPSQAREDAGVARHQRRRQAMGSGEENNKQQRNRRWQLLPPAALPG